MPRYELTIPGTPDRPGINPFTKASIVIKGRPAVHKFWEVERDGNALHFASGRDGRQTVRWSRDYVDGMRAEQVKAAAIEGRVAAGFKAAGKAVVLSTPAPSRQPTLTPWEDRVRSSPGDDDLLAACAAAIRKEVKLGELPAPVAAWAAAEDDRLEIEWHHGFVRKARFALQQWEADGPSLEEMVAALLAHPVGRFIQTLTIGLNSVHGQCAYEDVIAVIAAAQPPLLYTLFIGDFVFPDDTELSWAVVGDADALWTLPSLHELTLQGSGIRLGAFDAPHLERLEIRTGGLRKAV